MCFQSQESFKKVKKGFMSDEMFYGIVNQLNKYPDTKKARFAFHLGGEPLLHKHIADFVKYTSNLGFHTNLVTNAVLLTEEKSRKLIEADLQVITFSFEGYSKEIYENYRIGADYGRVKSNIENFLRLKNEMKGKVKTVLEIIDLPDVQAEKKKQFLEEMNSKGFDKISVSGYFDWLGKVKSIDFSKQKYYGCDFPDIDLDVRWNGEVVPCCMDTYGELIIGDFNTMSYEEVLLSEERQNLKRKLLKGKIDDLICGKCLYPWGGIEGLVNEENEIISM